MLETLKHLTPWLNKDKQKELTSLEAPSKK